MADVVSIPTNRTKRISQRNFISNNKIQNNKIKNNFIVYEHVCVCVFVCALVYVYVCVCVWVWVCVCVCKLGNVHGMKCEPLPEGP